MTLPNAKRQKKYFAKVQKAATEGGGYYSQFRIIRPDTDETVWLEERADSVTDENGKVIKLVGASIDITDLKSAEEAVRKSEEQVKQFNVQLEHQVKERTEELNEKNKPLQLTV